MGLGSTDFLEKNGRSDQEGRFHCEMMLRGGPVKQLLPSLVPQRNMAATMLPSLFRRHLSSKRWHLSVLAVLLLLLATRPLSAQPSTTKAKERAAKKACSTGDFQKGVDILADLYVDSNDPTYVFNQARCYQQNERPEQALGRFHEYLRKVPDLPAKDRVDVDRYVNECEALVAKLHPQPSQAVPEPTPVETVDVHAAHPATSASLSTSSQNVGRSLRTTGMATVGVGLVVVGVGVAFNLAANHLADEIRAGRRLHPRQIFDPRQLRDVELGELWLRRHCDGRRCNAVPSRMARQQRRTVQPGRGPGGPPRGGVFRDARILLKEAIHLPKNYSVLAIAVSIADTDIAYAVGAAGFARNSTGPTARERITDTGIHTEPAQQGSPTPSQGHRFGC